MKTTTGTSMSAWLRDDFQLTTWLLIGACTQSILFLLLPYKLALLSTSLLLLPRIFLGIARWRGLVHNPYADNVLFSPKTTGIPTSDGMKLQSPSETGVVMLVLGVRSSHPLGRFAPGFQEIGGMLDGLWKHAAADGEKWGYLGKTSALLDTENDAGNSLIWLSYWRSLEQLHAWAAAEAHRGRMNWYLGPQGKRYKHIGLMHETYVCGPGDWETIYHNLRPMGMGLIKVHPRSEDGDGAEVVGPLVDAKGREGRSMYGRMGRSRAH